MGLREIKKQLNKMDKRYKPVKEYLEFKLNPVESMILSKYKEKIGKCFSPIRGMQFKFSLAKQSRKLSRKDEFLALIFPTF